VQDRKLAEAQIQEFIESWTISLPKIVDRKSFCKVPCSETGRPMSKGTRSLGEEKTSLENNVNICEHEVVQKRKKTQALS